MTNFCSVYRTVNVVIALTETKLYIKTFINTLHFLKIHVLVYQCLV